jgi:hypothetical protein
MSENTLSEKVTEECVKTVICQSCRNICDDQVLDENSTDEQTNVNPYSDNIE